MAWKALLLIHFRLAIVVSRGAVLTALHKQALGVRYLECSIGFGWDEQYDPTVHTHGAREKVKKDAWDPSIEIVCDRAQWLFISVCVCL